MCGRSHGPPLLFPCLRTTRGIVQEAQNNKDKEAWTGSRLASAPHGHILHEFQRRSRCIHAGTPQRAGNTCLTTPGCSLRPSRNLKPSGRGCWILASLIDAHILSGSQLFAISKQGQVCDHLSRDKASGERFVGDLSLVAVIYDERFRTKGELVTTKKSHPHHKGFFSKYVGI